MMTKLNNITDGEKLGTILRQYHSTFIKDNEAVLPYEIRNAKLWRGPRGCYRPLLNQVNLEQHIDEIRKGMSLMLAPYRIFINDKGHAACYIGLWQLILSSSENQKAPGVKKRKNTCYAAHQNAFYPPLNEEPKTNEPQELYANITPSNPKLIKGIERLEESVLTSSWDNDSILVSFVKNKLEFAKYNNLPRVIANALSDIDNGDGCVQVESIWNNHLEKDALSHAIYRAASIDFDCTTGNFHPVPSTKYRTESKIRLP